MRVLYIGDSNPGTTSCHRANALRRIGHEVDIWDPYFEYERMMKGLFGAINYRTGYVLIRAGVLRWLRAQLVAAPHYDVCWVDSGELLSADAIKQLKKQCRKVVLYNHDDPTGQRDYTRFITLRRAIPCYDLCVVVRPINVDECKQLGAVDVMNVWRRYDEVAHKEPPADVAIPDQFKTDVAFIGYCINGEKRDRFIYELIQAGLTPAVWGDNWDRSEMWSKIKPYWRGGSLVGEDYVNAIRGAKVCLGLLSKGNRDEHTTRSLEIPYAGGLLCAERTSEHLALFEEGKEAIFWSSPQECAAQCRKLLSDAALRENVRSAGQRKVIDAHLGNEDLARQVLQYLFPLSQATEC